MKTIYTIILLLLCFSGKTQNTVVLKTGEYVYGKILSVDEKNISIEAANKNRTYKYSISSVSSYYYKIVDPFNSKQTDKLKNPYKTPGKELQIAAAHFELGTALAILGGGAIVLGATNMASKTKYNLTNKEIETNKYVGIGGGVLALAGLILQIESFSHFRKAGILLDKNSVGVAIKF